MDKVINSVKITARQEDVQRETGLADRDAPFDPLSALEATAPAETLGCKR